MSWHSSADEAKLPLDLERGMLIQLSKATRLEVLGVGNAAPSDAPMPKYRGRICGRAGQRVYIVPGSAFAMSALGPRFADAFTRRIVRRPSLDNGSRSAFTLAAEACDLEEGEGESSNDVEFTVHGSDITVAHLCTEDRADMPDDTPQRTWMG
jgi:hypothetical protein